MNNNALAKLDAILTRFDNWKGLPDLIGLTTAAGVAAVLAVIIFGVLGQ